MGSGSREYDFNTMADMGRQMSENKKALDDVRSEFVGPVQEEEAPPEPTPVILDGPATEEGDNKVNLNELAYAAKRRMEEEGHPAADILLTPNNVKKLADFETKARRVEKERLAYEADPENYDLNSANALDAYTKSWNLKNLTPDQLHPGPSTWKPGAADEASASSVAPEVSRVAPDRGNREQVDGGGSPGSKAPAPGRQPASSSERHTAANPVPAGKSAASPTPKSPSKTNNGITTGPNPPAPLNNEKPSVPAPVEQPSKKGKSFTPLPNQKAAELLGVPKAQRVKEYETPSSDGIVPLSTMGKAVKMMGGDFVRGAKGLGGMATSAVDSLMHPYGREGEDDRNLATAKAKKKTKLAADSKKDTKKKG